MSKEDAEAQMPADLVFVSGVSDLDGDVEGRLDSLAAFLEAHPEVTKLQVRGHASSEGAEDINKKISLRRAKNVMHYLVRKGVKRSRLSPFGAGESEPLVEDDGTEETRRKNRRVEIRVLRVK